MAHHADGSPKPVLAWTVTAAAALLDLEPGSIGADARAMGGAILPLYSHFAPSHEFFLKVDAPPPAV